MKIKKIILMAVLIMMIFDQASGASLSVYVRDPGGDTIAAEVPPDATVHDLKAQVAEPIGKPSYSFSLRFAGATIDDEQLSLSDAGVGQEAVVDVEVDPAIQLALSCGITQDRIDKKIRILISYKDEKVWTCQSLGEGNVILFITKEENGMLSYQAFDPESRFEQYLRYVKGNRNVWFPKPRIQG